MSDRFGPPVVTPLSEQDRMMFIVGMGVVGGLAIGKMAYDHMFKVGLSPEERKTMLFMGGGALAVYALATLFDVDRKYWEVSAAVEAVQEALK